MEPLKCSCNRGYASEYDNLCCFCRENSVSRALAKSVNVRHRGDGMSVVQYQVLIGELKRSEVYL